MLRKYKNVLNLSLRTAHTLTFIYIGTFYNIIILYCVIIMRDIFLKFENARASVTKYGTCKLHYNTNSPQLALCLHAPV